MKMDAWIIISRVGLTTVNTPFANTTGAQEYIRYRRERTETVTRVNETL